MGFYKVSFKDNPPIVIEASSAYQARRKYQGRTLTEGDFHLIEAASINEKDIGKVLNPPIENGKEK